MGQGHSIEVVRGGLEPAVGDELVAFWSGQGALSEAAARQRLAEVVCVLRDESGAVAGANSAYADRVEVVGGRRFWIYRSFIRPDLQAVAGPAMTDAAFAALEEEFAATGEGPIGLCVPVPPERAAARPEVVWEGGPGFHYAGHAADGDEIRIAYFDGAVIGPGVAEQGEENPQLGPGLRIDVFAAQDEVSEQDVIDLWTREGVIPPAEAQRRILEVLLVGVHDEDGVVGVSTAYLQRNAQLDMHLWYYRAFVAPSHRMSSMAVLLALQGRDLLKQRYVDGSDVRGAGVVYEVENDGLKRYFNHALWLPTEFTFIGENERGDHVRVHYFPGAEAPRGRGG
ncbi:MAG: hypothetical protein U0R24_07565 [Solirubrobacterales bacterium]